MATVAEEDLCAATDPTLIEVCRAEGRCLVTLDLDFANPLRFRPERFAGIAVLRLGGRTGRSGLEALIRTLMGAVEAAPITGCLWIVEPGRVRAHERTEE